MSKFSVLLVMVAVVAIAMPALGSGYTYNWQVAPGTTGDWWWTNGIPEGDPGYLSNWYHPGDGWDPETSTWARPPCYGIPDTDWNDFGTHERAYIQNGGTVEITTTTPFECCTFMPGGWDWSCDVTGYGHALMQTAGVVFSPNCVLLGHGSFLTDPTSTITQSAGSMTPACWVIIGSGRDGATGNGAYYISGGTIAPTRARQGYMGVGLLYGMSYSGSTPKHYRPTSVYEGGLGRGTGLLEIDNRTDSPTITLPNAFIMNSLSTTRFILNSSGATSAINVTGGDCDWDPAGPISGKAYVSGTVAVDHSAYSGGWSIGDAITLLTTTDYANLGTQLLAYRSADHPMVATDVTFGVDDVVPNAGLDAGSLTLNLTMNPGITEGFRLTDDGNDNLQVVYTTIADLNCSAATASAGSIIVDGDDLDIILADWSKTVTAGSTGDVTGDGVVDGLDLDYILADWGQTKPSSIPEPITLTLLGFGGLALLRRRCR